MVDVRAFRGLRYNTAIVGDLSRVISDPYDIISPEQQKRLYDINSYNIVRLELGLEHADDNYTNNKYTRAAETLRTWKSQQVLKQDQPSFYLTEHGFHLDG